MNYRHSFHAGNFADLVKHALVLWTLKARQAKGPVAVIDTHAGAGLYDLSGDAARSKEAEAGVAKLMAADGLPPLLAALAAEVAAVNPGGGARFYPGSPVLAARALRPGDAYAGFDLNPPIAALLAEALKPWPQARAQEGDGYAAAPGQVSGVAAGNALVLIDPPFERPDDYHRAADTAAAVLRADPAACVLIWTPLKDMETFDGFIRRLEAARAGPVLAAEARLRPLTDPMKMNGCAVVFVNPPDGADAAARQVCEWAVAALGSDGGRAEVWRP